jgi:pyruvate-formate lyase-activating enzyme
MKIAIIDADLVGRKKHRFPNLVCEKISGYYKTIVGLKHEDVVLKMDYEGLEQFDRVFIAKVFTDTPVPNWLQNVKQPKELLIRVGMPNAGELPVTEWLQKTVGYMYEGKTPVNVGGTGFFFDRAPNLPNIIEHCMPDYHLYDDWIQSKTSQAEQVAAKSGQKFDKKKFLVQFKEYLNYSIGYLTRGCFRHCGFCVNQKYNRVFRHSHLQEFFDPDRKYICLLDDNFFGYRNWKPLLGELIATGRKFKFKQGMDERLLTEDIAKSLFSSKYDGDYTFAFDNIEDYELIHSKLKIIKPYKKNRSVKFYVLVGYRSTDAEDIKNAFKRIELLMQYHCLPYIMRYQNKNETPWKDSSMRTMYVAMARWCNQPNIFKKMSFREFCLANQAYRKTSGLCSSMKAMVDFESAYPQIAKRFFDLKYMNYPE